MRYPGGKNNNGSYQQIISEIPLHGTYIELFSGSAAVYRNMYHSGLCYLVDLNPSVLPASMPSNTVCVCEDVLSFLDGYKFDGSEFIYADPPYLYTTRRAGYKRIYKHEFGFRFQHNALLDRLCRLPCMVAISGYWSELYQYRLAFWRLKTWTVRTRTGVASEYLWMNYGIPALLQDGRYVGSNYVDRQRLRRLAGVEVR